MTKRFPFWRRLSFFLHRFHGKRATTPGRDPSLSSLSFPVPSVKNHRLEPARIVVRRLPQTNQRFHPKAGLLSVQAFLIPSLDVRGGGSSLSTIQALSVFGFVFHGPASVAFSQQATGLPSLANRVQAYASECHKTQNLGIS
ncbi:hypothetical protein MPNT_10062 [Candidatus Methylacidithermus pantelleriae]|uniref:Uncharacterized protein n=1 Tax=Candidatus Methylacidithermus pantelleriae TaxID=2744239 RepID=A0A8J2FUT7_9BACT|nr:hypothetical protein MPNT_10062 [Candidatus Methylacidithermus pantelleriae]